MYCLESQLGYKDHLKIKNFMKKINEQKLKKIYLLLINMMKIYVWWKIWRKFHT